MTVVTSSEKIIFSRAWNQGDIQHKCIWTLAEFTESVPRWKWLLITVKLWTCSFALHKSINPCRQHCLWIKLLIELEIGATGLQFTRKNILCNRFMLISTSPYILPGVFFCIFIEKHVDSFVNNIFFFYFYEIIPKAYILCCEIQIILTKDWKHKNP